MRIKNRKAQIWVETVIYTLIGLVIIGVVLAIATPAIERYKDEILLEQTISALNELNSKVLEIRKSAVGNVRIIEFRIKKGGLILDCTNEKITYLLEETNLQYSEPGVTVEQGSIDILTEERGKKYDVSLSLDYSEKNLDLVYNGENLERIFHQASVPYKLYIENLGEQEGKTQININVVS